MSSTNSPHTAYPESEKEMRGELQAAPLMASTFQRPIERCDPEQCKGMCCYDGVYLEEEEVQVIEALVEQEREAFQSYGLNLPETIIVEGEWEGRKQGKKTAVRPMPFSREVTDFPAHFEDHCCIFLLEDGRCSLQVLSEDKGLHPWYYKPLTCWLHPISTFFQGENAISLVDEQTDPYLLPHYHGFACRTFCGRTKPEGSPAAVVLQEELTLLGQIVGRDLLDELQRSTEPPKGDQKPLPVEEQIHDYNK